MTATDKSPLFDDGLHERYITRFAKEVNKPTSYEGAATEHLRISGVYWSVAALSLLRPPEEVDRLMNLTQKSKTEQQDATIIDRPTEITVDVQGGVQQDPADEIETADSTLNQPIRTCIVDWVFDCYDEESGGFGGSIGHDGHILYTLSAIQILAITDHLNDSRLKVHRILHFISSLQQPDGSFAGDAWGEIDTRFSYCAISCLSLLRALPSLDGASDSSTDSGNDIINIHMAVDYIAASCRNFDGGFGCVPGGESHAGQIFCCVGALAIAGALNRLDDDLICWWLAERQCDSGGLNGRPEKQADVCYSWWILSALSILGRVHWINTSKLQQFILNCQDDEEGGIADRPNDMTDVFHTFFGIAGLSLLEYFDGDHPKSSTATLFRDIDPLYALPVDVVERMNLRGQVIVPEGREPTRVLKRYCEA